MYMHMHAHTLTHTHFPTLFHLLIIHIESANIIHPKVFKSYDFNEGTEYRWRRKHRKTRYGALQHGILSLLGEWRFQEGWRVFATAQWELEPWLYLLIEFLFGDRNNIPQTQNTEELTHREESLYCPFSCSSSPVGTGRLSLVECEQKPMRKGILNVMPPIRLL